MLRVNFLKSTLSAKHRYYRSLYSIESAKEHIFSEDHSDKKQELLVDQMCEVINATYIPARESIYQLERELTIATDCTMSLVRLKTTTKKMLNPHKGSPPIWLKKYSKNSVFIDIGANIGLYSFLSAAWGSELVVAVEPMQVSCAEIQKSMHINTFKQLKVINAVCSPIDFYNRQDLKIMAMEAPGNFAGVSNLKLSDIHQDNVGDESSPNKSLTIAPMFTIEQLINLTQKLHQSHSNASTANDFFSKLIIKIDTDCVDDQLLNDLLTLGIAKKLKAIIVEAKYSESLSEKCESYGTKIVDYSNNDILIRPRSCLFDN